MTKQYDIIHLPDGFMYGIEPKAPCPKNSWVIFCTTKNGEITGYNKPVKALYDYAANGNYNLLVVFTNNPSLGLPLLPDINNVQEYSIGEKEWNEYWTNTLKKESCATNGKREVFLAGYKSASAKKYTEEDMWKASLFGYDCALNNESNDGMSTQITKQEFNIWLQSLSPKPIAVEVEMKFKRYMGAVDCGDFANELHDSIRLKLIDNKVVIKQWIYEKV